MHVTFRQMRLVLALAETGSVGGAARVMHVTQPTASMQLKEVAQSVGLPLYEVVARRVHMTQAGWELARTARSIMAEWANFEQVIDAQRGLTRGQLRLSVVSTAANFMPRLLGAFCERHPEVDIALEVLNRDGVVARLRDNLDDLYIMSMPPAHMDLQDTVFMPNPLVLIAASDHALVGKARVPLKALQEARFVLRERGSGTRMAADEHFRRLRFKPQVRLELGSNEAIQEAVAGHLGLSVMSVHALGDPMTRSGISVLDVQGFPVQSQWHIVQPKGKRSSPLAQAFQKHLLDAAGR